MDKTLNQHIDDYLFLTQRFIYCLNPYFLSVIEMPVFPTAKMAGKWAVRICRKLQEQGKLPAGMTVEQCVNLAKTAYSSAISDIDSKWADGLIAFIQGGK